MMGTRPSDDTCITVIRSYLPTVLVANFIWEVLHLPLYTVWSEGMPRYLVFAVLHYTSGDFLIALTSLSLALILGAPARWPAEGFVSVAALATSLGIAYTIFNE